MVAAFSLEGDRGGRATIPPFASQRRGRGCGDACRLQQPGHRDRVNLPIYWRSALFDSDDVQIASLESSMVLPLHSGEEFYATLAC